jgi:hypothetical protein
MSSTASHNTAESSGQQRQRGLSTTRTASTLIVFIALAAVFFTKEPASWIGGGVLPPDPLEAANVILRKTPVIVRLAPQFDLDDRLISTILSPTLAPFLLHPVCCPWTGFVPDKRQDGHIDLAWLARLEYGNNVTSIDLDKPTIGHVDIPRLRSGHVGGFFWCVSHRLGLNVLYPVLFLILGLQVDIRTMSR